MLVTALCTSLSAFLADYSEMSFDNIILGSHRGYSV